MTVKFCQIVLGPPGSGKTTYCKAMSILLKEVGRNVSIINLGKDICDIFSLYFSFGK